jgi:hypothetical protein
MSSRTRSLNPLSVASVLTDGRRHENERTTADDSPKGIVPDLLPHLTRAPPDVAQKRRRRDVRHPQQDLPYPRPQSVVLNRLSVIGFGRYGGIADFFGGYALDQDKSSEFLERLLDLGGSVGRL